MSSPVVAGIAALYFQKNPNADWEEVKNAIINCADRDAFTGNALPDNRWGYGKVNAYSTVKGCTVGLEEIENSSSVLLSNYPNPFHGSTLLRYDISTLKSYHTAVIKVFDTFGRTISEIKLTDDSNILKLDAGTFAAGIYNCSLIIDGRQNKTVKMMVY